MSSEGFSTSSLNDFFLLGEQEVVLAGIMEELKRKDRELCVLRLALEEAEEELDATRSEAEAIELLNLQQHSELLSLRQQLRLTQCNGNSASGGGGADRSTSASATEKPPCVLQRRNVQRVEELHPAEAQKNEGRGRTLPLGA
jgi:hypothetical protein